MPDASASRERLRLHKYYTSLLRDSRESPSSISPGAAYRNNRLSRVKLCLAGEGGTVRPKRQGAVGSKLGSQAYWFQGLSSAELATRPSDCAVCKRVRISLSWRIFRFDKR